MQVYEPKKGQRIESIAKEMIEIVRVTKDCALAYIDGCAFIVHPGDTRKRTIKDIKDARATI